MAQGFSRINLAAASFPLSFLLQGRSVFLGRWDQNYVRDVNSKQDEDRDHGIAQLYYGHNIMPTGVGYQSVGYAEQLAAFGGTDFDKIYNLRDIDDNRFLFVPAGGLNYVYDPNYGNWQSCSPLATASADTLVTTAFIRGTTYICYAGLGVFTYDTATRTMVAATLTGVVLSSVLGVCAAQGYMIVWDATAIAWSTPTNELDFAPSVLTGAGGGNVYDTRANIVVVLPINNGFIVYTRLNAVSGSFSGNVNLPFVLKEVAGSGGVISSDQITWDGNLSAHYGWTTVGFQQIDKSSAKLFFTDLTDFLSARIFEDFDEATNQFNVSFLTSPLSVKVTVCAERFILISYGVSTGDFTHVIVYDLGLKRWGKLKVTHVDAFDYIPPAISGAVTYTSLITAGTTYEDLFSVSYQDLINGAVMGEVTPKSSIGFLSSSGQVVTASLDWHQLADTGCLLLGKYQFSRERLMVLLGTEVETVFNGSNFAIQIFPSLDGKNFDTPITPTSRNSRGLIRAYNCQSQAMNHSIMLQGSFYVTSVNINFTKGGVAMIGSSTSTFG